MESSTVVNNSASNEKWEEERVKMAKRAELKRVNAFVVELEPSKLDSSLKRHTALIKRMRQSMASDNRDQILKDIDTLSLERYVDEIAGAAVEGIGRCKNEKDVWSTVEILSSFHRRFPSTFTPVLVNNLYNSLYTPTRAVLAAMPPDQREREDSTRVARQRPVLRVCAELAMVGIIKDSPGRSGGEWIMKAMKELLSNDPSLSSLPLLSIFLKSYAYPFLGLLPPATSSKQISSSAEPGTLSALVSDGVNCFPPLSSEDDALIEQEIRDRFKRMCEGYFENICKKLVKEHTRLQDQDRRNHEAYIKSGEIFEDRQQAYEKMTKSYEKLLASCQLLSELLYMSLPTLPTGTQKSESILIGTNDSRLGTDDNDAFVSGGKWEDEEERKFFEDVQDLKDFVPSSVLGIDESESNVETDEDNKTKQEEVEREEVRKLTEELEKLRDNPDATASADVDNLSEVDDDLPTPTATSPKAGSAPTSPHLAPQGPSQLLTALLARLPDATNRAMIDQAAIDFSFLNSKAARKRLIKFFGQVPKNRTDLLPHYSRLVATLNPYMPDIGTSVVAILDEEFRYLQKKKNVVKELSEVRLKNIIFLSSLTKFRVVPTHLILHMFKVCLDDFSGTNIDNIALLVEGCGRFLLRSDDTRQRFATMLELMRRKQNMQHLDQRQQLLLENAYYQCNPPERAPREEKERSNMEMFIRYLIYDVLAKKSIDKVFKLVRKLDWNDPEIRHVLFKAFTKPWKIKYSNISLLAMLIYDLQRYYSDFTVSVVDQVLEDIRLGLEQNVYKTNQRRVAVIRYLGELYIYRLVSSSIVFDTLWSLVTFGHPDGRPMPSQICPLDTPDDFFRIRLACFLLDTCGMCFDRGSHKKKLDNFLIYFQYYIHCKESLPMDVDFMVSDSLEALRPKFHLVKTLEEAVVAVDEMLNLAFQTPDVNDDGDESGDESGDEADGDRREIEEKDDEDEEDTGENGIADNDRAPSPDLVVLSGSNSEDFGPSAEAEAEFAKELAKLVTDNTDSRKVDKKTALALWDSAVIPRKKRGDERADEGESMNFTIITKRGNKQQARPLAIPASSALAEYTRSAQLQDKVEQQQLKRLVLDYEQREEAEEMKALEARSRPIKIRYVG